MLVLQGAKELGKECAKGRNVFAFFYPDHQNHGHAENRHLFLFYFFNLDRQNWGRDWMVIAKNFQGDGAHLYVGKVSGAHGYFGVYLFIFPKIYIRW